MGAHLSSSPTHFINIPMLEKHARGEKIQTPEFHQPELPGHVASVDKRKQTWLPSFKHQEPNDKPQDIPLEGVFIALKA